jgi:thiamine biosynthesis lipoprotein
VTATEPLQRRLRVMGSATHVIVHGGSPELLHHAEERLRELESLWSRFLPDSDITRANRAGGSPVAVHDDTLAVVGRALDAWRQTGGRFDITVLPALVSAGYTRSAITHTAAPEVNGTRIGQSALVHVDYAAGTLTVPATTAIDLGGIGKGFAADIVAEELMEAGAHGVIVNVGGDLSILGRPLDGGPWYLGIEDPLRAPEHLAFLYLDEGGVATSGTTVHRWAGPDGSAHHIIDPVNAAPSRTPLLTATVLAGDAATGEAFATAAMMVDGAEAMVLLESVGLAGLAVATDGTVFRTSNLEDFEL